MSNTQESLILKFSAQFDNWKSGFADASSSYSGFLNQLGGGKNLLAGVTVGVGALGAAAFGLAKMAANTGDEIGTMAERAGVAVKDFSLLKFAIEQSDGDVAALSVGLKKLSQGLLDAQDPGSKAAALFEAIGVKTKAVDGSLRPVNDVLLDIADRFKDIEDPTLKSALALEVFGKSGSDMVPFLSKGGDEIEALMLKGEKLGAAWDELSAQQASDFNDALHSMTTAAGSLGKEIGVALFPPFTALMNFLADVARPIFHSIKAVFLLLAADATTLASGLAAVYLGATKVSDALGITENASEGAREVFDAMTASAEDLRKRAGETFEVMVTGSAKAKTETEKLQRTQKESIKITADHVNKIVNKEKIEKEAAKATKDRAKAQEESGKAILEMAQLEMKASEQIEARRKREQEEIGRAILETAQLERRVMDENARLHGLAQEAMGREIQARAVKEQEALQQSRDNWNQWFNLTADLTGTFRQFSFETFDFVKQSFGDAVAGMILRGESLKDSLKAIWDRILEAFISMLVQMGVEYVAQHAIMQAFAAAHPIIQPTVLAPVGGPGGAAATGAATTGALTAGGGASGAGLIAAHGSTGATAAAMDAAATGSTAAVGTTGAGAVGPTTTAGALGVTAAAFIAWDPSLVMGGRQGSPEEQMANLVYGQIIQRRRSPAEALALIKRQFPSHANIDWDMVRRITSMHIATQAGEVRVPFTLETIDPTAYGLWAGGIVSKPMLAKVAEGGESEVVAPLSRLREMLGGFGGGGGGNVFHLNFPGLTSFGQLTVHQAEQHLKTVYSRASENLSRRGHKWGMKPRST